MTEDPKRWPVFKAHVRLHDPDDNDHALMGTESLVSTRVSVDADGNPVEVTLRFTAGPNHLSLRFDPDTAIDLAAQLAAIARSIIYRNR